MPTDDLLRRDLIELSRQRALGDRNRLTGHSPISLAMGFAAGLLLPWALFGRKRGVASAALLLLGSAWLAAPWLRSALLQTLFEDAEPHDESPDPNEWSLDEAGRESFPASDPPARRHDPDAS